MRNEHTPETAWTMTDESEKILMDDTVMDQDIDIDLDLDVDTAEFEEEGDRQIDSNHPIGAFDDSGSQSNGLQESESESHNMLLKEVTDDRMQGGSPEPGIPAGRLEDNLKYRYDHDDDWEEDDTVYAGFFVRLTAYLLDRFIIAIPLGILRTVLFVVSLGAAGDILRERVFFMFSPIDILLYALTVLYFIIPTYIGGKTIGKKLMRICVVSTEERAPSFFEIFFRETFGRFLSAFVLCIGYLIIGAGDEKEALHDHLADTRVIYIMD